MKNPGTTALAGSAALLLLGAGPAPTPPSAPRKDHAQVFHGRSFTDPYFWLREKDSPDVLKYLADENAYTEAMTAELRPFSEALYAELLGRVRQTDVSVPTRDGAYDYYSRTVEGLQYPIRCRKAADPDGGYREGAAEEVLLDANELAKGKAFLGIGDFVVSDDARRLAFTTDETGFRQYRLFVKDLATGAVEGPLAERVTSLAWAADHRTLFYVSEDAVTKRADTLQRLTLGGAPAVVYREKDEHYSIGISRTKDRRYMVLKVAATDTWEQRLLRADAPRGAFRVVLRREKGHKYDVEHRDGTLYLRTNKDAKNFRLVTTPLADPSPGRWQTLVEHRADVLLDDFQVFRDFLVVTEKRAGLNRLRIRRFADGRWSEVLFPEPAYTTFAMSVPQFDSRVLRYDYQSLVTPSSVYDYDMETGAATLRKRKEVLGGYDASRYVSERLWATARDGVRVPISIVYRRDRPRDGRSPLFLYGYGSYGAGMYASFDSENLSLLDRGLAYAIAHVRGGDEMGEAWHDDGMLLRKKNTFYDFVDCALFLVQEGYASRDGLLIEGGSAGGLLMGAVVNERPDLFRAVHAAVPYVDVINTMMDASIPLTAVEYLEWGNPNEKPAFDYMLSYSPYDNLAAKAYPAMLVTTSYNDSQVMYWEPAKYVAKMRSLRTSGSGPLLLKTRMQPAGHGGASGRYDALADRAFELAWLLRQVGITR
jgi:oligopeptidase B